MTSTPRRCIFDEPLIDRHIDPACFPVGMLEARNIEELYEEIRQGGPIPRVPLIVVTAMGIDPSQTTPSLSSVGPESAS